MNNSIVFITGMTGFVGKNLQPYLAKDFKVEGISRKESPDGLTYKMFLEGNAPYDAIIHLAGKAHDLKKSANDKEYYDVNFGLTKLLYDQFLQSDAEKFIYISSVKAVADTVVGSLKEEVTAKPVTVYGKSKLMAEDYILSNLSSSKKVYILRPCMIHGPENKGNLNLLFRIVIKGFPWPLGAFKNQRSFCSIENLCFVIRELLAQESVPSGVYNVADDEALSTNDLIQLIATSQKKQARILHVSKEIVASIARIGGFMRLPLNSERLQKLTESYVVSNEKIVSAIEKPLPIKSKEGLLKTFESFK